MKRTTWIAVILLAWAFGAGIVVQRTWLGPESAAASEPPGSGSGLPDSGAMSGHWTGRARAATPARGDLGEIARLPYARWTGTDADGAGVAVWDAAAAYDGLNLVVSGHAACAQIVDMSGRVLHEWRKDFADVWSQPVQVVDHDYYKTFWRRARVLDNGDLLAIYQNIGLIKLDKRSELIWARLGGYHHDLRIAEDGSIRVLERRWREQVPDRLAAHPTFLVGPWVEEYVAVLSPAGEEVESISLLDAFCASDYASVLSIAPRAGDFMHTNTIEVLDGRFAARHPMFRAGNLLVCARNVNTVAVVDPRVPVVVWALTGLWTYPHDPTVLGNGNLLVFDNLGAGGNSRVLELDPVSQQIAWRYQGTADEPFRSEYSGASQRLPNGNTLIVESTGGRAFEVTAEGRIVWEFLNPHVGGDGGNMVATLFDCVRLDAARFTAVFGAPEPARDR